MYQTRFTRVSICASVVGALVLGSPSPSFAEVFDAAVDFDYNNNTETSTWSYRADPDTATRGAAEPLLTVPNSEYLGGASANVMGWVLSAGANPGILKSTANEALFGGVIDVFANRLYASPNLSLGGAEVLSWLAPGPGVIGIDFDTRGAHEGGPIDYNWFIDLHNLAGSTNLAFGNVVGGNDTDSADLIGIAVVAGDRVNFAFDEGDSPSFDFLEFNAAIDFTAVPEPSALSLGLFVFIVCGWGFVRRRLRPGTLCS